MQWARVVHKVDSREVNVPISLIENYKEIEIAANQDCSVFWSQDPQETPDSILKKRGKILRIDKRKRIPTAGWYHATVLLLAESEEKLLQILEEQRLQVPAEQDKETESTIVVKEEIHNESRAINLNLILEEDNMKDASKPQSKKRCIEEVADESDEYMSKAVLEFQTLKFKTVKLEKRIESLIQIIIGSNNRVLELEELYEETKEKLATALAEHEKINELETCNKDLKKVLNENSSKISKLEELYKSTNDKLKVSLMENKRLAEFEGNNESLGQALSKKEKRILELEEFYKSATERLEAANTENQKMLAFEGQVKDLNLVLGEKNNQYFELEKIYKSACNALESAITENKKLVEFEKKNATLLQTLNEKNNDILKLKELHKSAYNEFKADHNQNKNTTELARNDSLNQTSYENNDIELEELETDNYRTKTVYKNDNMDHCERIEALMQTLCDKNNKCFELEELFKSIKNKLVGALTENKKLKQFNFMLQEQLLEKSPIGSVSCNKIPKMNESRESLSEESMESLPESYVIHRKSTRLNENPRDKLSHEYSTPSKNSKCKTAKKKILESQLFAEKDKADEINTYLDTKQIEACKRTKWGPSGDSSFVKKLANALWTPLELSERSCQGRQCPSKKDSVARPECTPKKKELIRRLFKERILEESPDTDIELAVKRLSKINFYLSSKISTVRRDMERKRREKANITS